MENYSFYIIQCLKICNYFTGNEQVLEIYLGVEGTYTIACKSLTMNKIHLDDHNEKTKEHDAIVFFPIPDGNAKTTLPPFEQ